jgi:hypothetical protein
VPLSRRDNAGQNHDTKTGNESFANGHSLNSRERSKNENTIKEETDGRMDSSHSVHSLLASRLLSRNVRLGMYTSTNLLVVWYGCEIWADIMGRIQNKCV